MAVRLINRTPHPIRLLAVVDGKEEWVEIPPTPPAARLQEVVEGEEWLEVELPDGRVGQVKVVVKRLVNSGDAIGEGEIVSLPMAQATGALAPDTGQGAVRDEKGNIVGVKWLCRIL